MAERRRLGLGLFWMLMTIETGHLCDLPARARTLLQTNGWFWRSAALRYLYLGMYRIEQNTSGPCDNAASVLAHGYMKRSDLKLLTLPPPASLALAPFAYTLLEEGSNQQCGRLNAAKADPQASSSQALSPVLPHSLYYV